MSSIKPRGICGDCAKKEYCKDAKRNLEMTDCNEFEKEYYIKREDAQDIIDIVLSDYLTDGERTILEDVSAEIGEMPSADVVEVKHGHWECEEVQCIFGKKFILTCSECGKSVSVTEEALPEEHYCRSCGARMDGNNE